MPPESQRLRARRAALEARARILRAVRAWFAEEGFLEVETPARVPSPGQEVHLDAIPASSAGAEQDVRWLVTSPEYHMKRLCAAGYQKIVQIGKAWRAEERGPHHEPEFTIIEWYRAGAPLETIARDCEALLRAGAAAAGIDPAARAIDLPFRRTTVAALVKAHAGFELAGDETAEALRDKAIRAGAFAGAAPPPGAAWDDVFFQLFLDRIEPALARGGPTFVLDWPSPLGALARRRPDDPRFVERLELYAGGLELANGFGELTDPVEQRARFEDETRQRAARGKAVYPIDEKLLAALPEMPETAGIALGFDRMVMFLLGAAEIRDVIAFAADEA